MGGSFARVLGVALFVGAVGSLSGIASPLVGQANPLEVGTVDTVNVAGIATRVLTANLESREDGEAVLFLHGGGGSPIEAWGQLMAPAADLAPVVAYDRPGIGQSSWDGREQTLDRVVEHARELMTVLDVAPPYVLVGHSWGGPIILTYAGTYPDEVAGLVYIDPTEPDFTWEMLFQTTDEDLLVERIAEWDALIGDANLPPSIAAEYAVVRRFFGTPIDERSFPPHPAIPTSMILGTKYSETGMSFADEAWFIRSQQQRTDRILTWMRQIPDATFMVATDAGHFVHADDPVLVTEAVRRVVEAARR